MTGQRRPWSRYEVTGKCDLPPDQVMGGPAPEYFLFWGRALKYREWQNLLCWPFKFTVTRLDS